MGSCRPPCALVDLLAQHRRGDAVLFEPVGDLVRVVADDVDHLPPVGLRGEGVRRVVDVPERHGGGLGFGCVL
jgi:hypothetical protein